VSRSDDERVADILEATDQLAQLVERGRAEFDTDFVVRLAVERLLEIIGEAANALSDEGRSGYPAIEWRDMAGLRIVLAHHYDRIYGGQVWTIASHDVPVMAARFARPLPELSLM